MALVKEIIDTIKQAFSPRDRLVEEREALAARQATEASALTRDVVNAEAEVVALDEPRRRLERLQAERFGLGLRHDRERAEQDRALQEATPREIIRYANLLDRLFDLARVTPPPSAVEAVNNIVGSRKITNLDDIERHLAVGPLLWRQRGEVHATLWRLPSAALNARLVELRTELEQAMSGTVFEPHLA